MTNPSSQDEPSRPICDYEGSDYRTAFWGGRGRQYEDLVERYALRSLLPPKGRRLLDIGAGFGRLASLYAGYEQVILFDYSRSQLEYARSRLGDERYLYVAGDIYHLPLAIDAADTTIMVRMLHHLADAPCALAHIQRVTAAQGTFVLEYANKRHLKNILRHVLGGGVDPSDVQPLEFTALHYNFHPAWVAEELERAGFSIEETRSLSLFRAALLKRILPLRLLVIMDRALQRATAPMALGPSIFVRTRTHKKGEGLLAPVERLFRCPDCGREPLDRADAGLHCAGCGADWPIENGVYLFK